ncbi:hypothetical protein Tco_1184657 [Tanacetum coccineum]
MRAAWTPTILLIANWRSYANKLAADSISAGAGSGELLNGELLTSELLNGGVAYQGELLNGRVARTAIKGYNLKERTLHWVNAKTCLQALRTQFKEFLASKGVNATDLLNQGWQQDFEYFTRCEPSAYRRELLENLDTLEAVIHRVVNTYGVLRMKENELNALKENGSQLHDEILHEHQIKSSVKMQSQDIQINPVQAMDDSLIVSKSSLIESGKPTNTFSKSEIETRAKASRKGQYALKQLDAGLVVTESSGQSPTAGYKVAVQGIISNASSRGCRYR